MDTGLKQTFGHFLSLDNCPLCGGVRLWKARPQGEGGGQVRLAPRALFLGGRGFLAGFPEPQPEAKEDICPPVSPDWAFIPQASQLPEGAVPRESPPLVPAGAPLLRAAHASQRGLARAFSHLWSQPSPTHAPRLTLRWEPCPEGSGPLPRGLPICPPLRCPDCL